MEPLSGFLTYLKLPIKALAGVGAVAAGILFLPSAWVGALGLSTIRTQYTAPLGIAVLLAVALLLIEAVAFAMGWLRHKAKHRQDERERLETAEREKAEKQRQRKRAREAVITFLEGMTDSERALCIRFIEAKERTERLNTEDGNVHELVRREVLYPSGSRARFNGPFADFTMTDSAWDYLLEHPDSLRRQRALAAVTGAASTASPGATKIPSQ
jgi:Super-infection exclusion protein B